MLSRLSFNFSPTRNAFFNLVKAFIALAPNFAARPAPATKLPPPVGAVAATRPASIAAVAKPSMARVPNTPKVYPELRNILIAEPRKPPLEDEPIAIARENSSAVSVSVGSKDQLIESATLSFVNAHHWLPAR